MEARPRQGGGQQEASRRQARFLRTSINQLYSDSSAIPGRGLGMLFSSLQAHKPRARNCC